MRVNFTLIQKFNQSRKMVKKIKKPNTKIKETDLSKAAGGAVAKKPEPPPRKR